MTDDEREMLKAVAASAQRTAADWVRLAIRQAYEALPPTPPAPSKAKTKRRA